jgi:hypothetical protein
MPSGWKLSLQEALIASHAHRRGCIGSGVFFSCRAAQASTLATLDSPAFRLQSTTI